MNKDRLYHSIGGHSGSVTPTPDQMQNIDEFIDTDNYYCQSLNRAMSMRSLGGFKVIDRSLSPSNRNAFMGGSTTNLNRHHLVHGPTPGQMLLNRLFDPKPNEAAGGPIQYSKEYSSRTLDSRQLPRHPKITSIGQLGSYHGSLHRKSKTINDFDTDLFNQLSKEKAVQNFVINIVRLQALCRGYLVRKRLKIRKTEVLLNNDKNVSIPKHVCGNCGKIIHMKNLKEEGIHWEKNGIDALDDSSYQSKYQKSLRDVEYYKKQVEILLEEAEEDKIKIKSEKEIFFKNNREEIDDLLLKLSAQERKYSQLVSELEESKGRMELAEKRRAETDAKLRKVNSELSQMNKDLLDSENARKEVTDYRKRTELKLDKLKIELDSKENEILRYAKMNQQLRLQMTANSNSTSMVRHNSEIDLSQTTGNDDSSISNQTSVQQLRTDLNAATSQNNLLQVQIVKLEKTASNQLDIINDLELENCSLSDDIKRIRKENLTKWTEAEMEWSLEKSRLQRRLTEVSENLEESQWEVQRLREDFDKECRGRKEIEDQYERLLKKQTKDKVLLRHDSMSKKEDLRNHDVEKYKEELKCLEISYNELKVKSQHDFESNMQRITESCEQEKVLLTNTISQLQNRLTDMTAELDQLKLKQKQISKEKNSLVFELTSSKSQVTSLKSRSNQLTSQIAEIRSQLTSQIQDTETLKSEKDSLRREIELLKDTLNEINDENTKELEKVENRVRINLTEEFEIEKQAQDEVVQRLMEDIENAQIELENCQIDQQQDKLRIKKLKSEMSALQDEYDMKQCRLKDVERRYTDIESELTFTQSKLATLQRLNAPSTVQIELPNGDEIDNSDGALADDNGSNNSFGSVHSSKHILNQADAVLSGKRLQTLNFN